MPVCRKRQGSCETQDREKVGEGIKKRKRGGDGGREGDKERGRERRKQSCEYFALMSSYSRCNLH